MIDITAGTSRRLPLGSPTSQHHAKYYTSRWSTSVSSVLSPPMSILELENQAQVALQNLLDNSEPFPLLDLAPFVDLIPRKMWTSPPDRKGLLVLGVSPRDPASFTLSTSRLPAFTKLVTTFVKLKLPTLQFTTIGIRIGGKYRTHVDPRVHGISGIVSASGDRPCGFWISSTVGKTFETFQGHNIPGCLIDVGQRPLLFDARTPHCSKHIGNPEDFRISISAFQPMRPSLIPPAVQDTLLSLGFPFPTSTRHLQTTLKSFFPVKRKIDNSMNTCLNHENTCVPEDTESSPINHDAQALLTRFPRC